MLGTKGSKNKSKLPAMSTESLAEDSTQDSQQVNSWMVEAVTGTHKVQWEL